MTAACVEGWVRAFAGLVLEVEAGLRPARHLRPMLIPELHHVVGGRTLSGRDVRAGDPPAGSGYRPAPAPRTTAIGSVHVQRRRGSCEAVVLLDDGVRTTAMAVALRRTDQGWRVVDVRRPEDPPLPVWDDEGHPIAGPADGGDGEHAAARPGWRVPDGWDRTARAA